MPINLEKFRKQHNDIKQRRDGKKDDDSFWMFPLEEGKKATYLIRLLPTKSNIVTDPESGWEVRATHTIGTKDNGYPNKILCPNYHGSEARCPACAIASKLFYSDSVELKEIGKKLFNDRKYWYNMVIKNADGEWKIGRAHV